MAGVLHSSQASSPTLQEVPLAPTLTPLLSGVHTVAKRNHQLVLRSPLLQDQTIPQLSATLERKSIPAMWHFHPSQVWPARICYWANPSYLSWACHAHSQGLVLLRRDDVHCLDGFQTPVLCQNSGSWSLSLPVCFFSANSNHLNFTLSGSPSLSFLSRVSFPFTVCCMPGNTWFSYLSH